MSYPVTIGLEVHTQLKTQSKIFCACAIAFGSEPNTLVCPVCLGLPGALPVLNRAVFRLGLRAVLALKGSPSTRIKFDRKNYFYPDLPKGYQISQFDAPLGQGGQIEILTGGKKKKVRLNRVHLEEDAGKLVHDISPRSSLVDLNRAGTPLIEIVSEPDMESAEEAYEYLSNLKAILKFIEVSDCDMEKGHLRCDANVSVRKSAGDPLGKKVEIKNLNSFKAVRSAIEYEITRQSEALEKGEKLTQETRLWDDAKQKTFTMRSKEEAHDYRYFPEPDLVPFSVSQEEVKKEMAALPKLPEERRADYVSRFALSEYDAVLLTQEKEISDFFDKTVQEASSFKGITPKIVANWITGAVFAYLGEKNCGIENTRLSPSLLIKTADLVQRGVVSLQAAKEKMLPEVMGTGSDPAKVLADKGLAQVSDDASLKTWIREAITANPKVIADFKAGKESAAMFLVGQVMKKSQGKANPGKVRELMLQTLKEGG